MTSDAIWSQDSGSRCPTPCQGTESGALAHWAEELPKTGFEVQSNRARV